MRKTGVIGFIILFWVSTVLAGGIVTNTNQSAQFIRTLNRNASTCIDAAYFNPAGLTKLEDGFYLSLSNQSIFQTKEVVNSYKGPQGNTGLNEDTFTGDVKAPLFPNLYVIYKTGNLAFSGAFVPIGGGGSAVYAKGLPSFEMPVSDLVPKLADLKVTGYKYDASFEGSSIYFGGQAGVAYKINDMLSVAVGARFVSASNSYLGHLENIQVKTPLASPMDWMAPAAYVGAVATVYSDSSTLLSGLATIYSDSATYFYTAATVAPTYNDSLMYVAYGDDYTNAAAMATYGSQKYAAGAAYLGDTVAVDLMAKTADKAVDVKQTGSGLAVIIAANITPMDGLNIGFRYETLTKLELVNDTKEDDTGEFPDGAKLQKDMPAMVAVGVSYKVMPKLTTEASFNYYMNTGVDWDGKEENVENGFEAGIAFEYAITDGLRASAGFLTSKGGALEAYQSDLDFTLDSNSIGFGVAYALSPNLEINLGVANTFFGEGQNTFTYVFDEDLEITKSVTEKYNKTSIFFAIGVNFKL